MPPSSIQNSEPVNPPVSREPNVDMNPWQARESAVAQPFDPNLWPWWESPGTSIDDLNRFSIFDLSMESIF
jgi:hypothetical protein